MVCRKRQQYIYFLGLDKAKEVANLVTESFGKPARKGDGGVNIFSHFLKLLGLEPKKLSAIALNAVLFLAQLVSHYIAYFLKILESMFMLGKIEASEIKHEIMTHVKHELKE